MLDATVRLGTIHKTIAFTAYNHNKMRSFTHYIQEQVMFYRQQQNGSPQPQVAVQEFPAAVPAPISAPAISPMSEQFNPAFSPVNTIGQAGSLPIVNTILEERAPTQAAVTAPLDVPATPAPANVMAELSQQPQRRPIINPYNKMPLIVRRRVSRFY